LTQRNDALDYYDDNHARTSGWNRLPPQLRAALIFSIPFIVADFFNYYSGGTALLLTTPILLVLFTGCGALGAKFASDRGRASHDLLFVGAMSGFLLWLLSLVVNGIIALGAGIFTFGVTLLLGIPYFCFCGPLNLLGGGIAGAIGAWLYRFFGGRRNSSFDDDGGWA
jgi:hypothetical protein